MRVPRSKISPFPHHSESEEVESWDEEYDLNIEETTDYEKKHELLIDLQSWAIKFNVKLINF